MRILTEKLNPVIPGRISDELYNKSIGVLNADPLNFSLSYKTRIIHLIDSCSRGYISPMEAFEAIEADYFPIIFEVRPSKYRHLIS